MHRQLLGGQAVSDQNRTGGMHVGNLLVDRWPEIIIEQGQCASVTYWWTGGFRSESDKGGCASVTAWWTRGLGSESSRGDARRYLVGGQVACAHNRTVAMCIGNLLVDRWLQIIIDHVTMRIGNLLVGSAR